MNTYYQNKKFKAFFLTFFGALVLSVSIIANKSFLIIGLQSLAIYFYLVWKRPAIHLYFFVLTSFNFFGYINPEVFLRLPSLFKFLDLMFVFACMIFFLKFAEDRLYGTKNIDFSIIKKNKFVFYMLIFILVLTVFQIFLTFIRFNLPFKSTIQSGRMFIFHFMGIYALFFIGRDKKEIKTAINFLISIAVIQSVFAILQNIVSFNFLGNTKIIQQGIDDYSVKRIYLPAVLYVLGVASFSFWKFFLSNKKSKKWILIFIICITGILLTYTRTLWGCAVLALILPVIFMDIGKTAKLVFCVFVIGLISISIISVIKPEYLEIINKRIYSAVYEINTYSGNFAYRFEENKKRLELVKKYPFFGPGFVHADYAPRVFNFINLHGRAAILQTNDSAWITMGVSFGFAGFLWVLAVLFYCFNIIKTEVLNQNKRNGIIFGLSSFVISIWLTSITTSGFTYTSGVSAFSFIIVLISLYKNERISIN